METKRGSFTGSLGFVLAAAASAVGLGNLWRFPYLAAQHGGGIFILCYIVLAVTFGFALMAAEISIGRKTGKSPIKAYGMVDKRFGFLGALATIIPAIILPYYCVIGGWIIKYMLAYVTGDAAAAAGDSYFGAFTGGAVEPSVYLVIFLMVTAFIVIAGVEKGVEKSSRIMMPLLLVLCGIVSIYVLTMPGTIGGLSYYLLPDFEKFSFKTVCAACGQMFYSMSLAMGIMVSYGSYMPKTSKITSSINQIQIFDTVVAVLAGLMIIPAVFAFAGEAGLASSGPGLMYVTLPKIFIQMPGGVIMGALFFALVLFAALTSSVSIMEAVVSSLLDFFPKMSRRVACIAVLVYAIVVGIFTSLGFGPLSFIAPLGMDLLTFFDYISNSVMMPIVALITCIMIGWCVGPKFVSDEVTRNGEGFAREKLFNVMIRFICPVMLLAILVFYTAAQFGFITV